MRAVSGVSAVVVLTVIGAVLWGGPVVRMWDLTMAQPCPADTPASNCLVTLPGRVVSRFDDRGDGDAVISLEVAGD